MTLTSRKYVGPPPVIDLFGVDRGDAMAVQTDRRCDASGRRVRPHEQSIPFRARYSADPSRGRLLGRSTREVRRPIPSREILLDSDLNAIGNMLGVGLRVKLLRSRLELWGYHGSRAAQLVTRVGTVASWAIVAIRAVARTG